MTTLLGFYFKEQQTVINLCASFERGNENWRLYCSFLLRMCPGTDKALHRGSCGSKKMRGRGTEGGGNLPESTVLKFDVKETTAAKGKQIQSNTKSVKTMNLLLLQTALSFK